MAIKRILGGKSKNLFDISKSNTNSRNYVVGDMFYCNTYGFNMGTVQQLCPSLKAGDVVILTMWCIKKYKSGPTYFTFGGHSGTIQVDNGIYPLISSFTITESDLTKPVYIYNQTYSDRDVPFELICRIQLEYGTTRTEYVPHDITSYKSIMKVSDVCQLADKSKFKASVTINGITCVSNGDGSITLNGTCTSGFALNPFNQYIPVDQTHIYYVSPYLSINYNVRKDGTDETGHISFIDTSAQPTKFNTVFYMWIAKDKSFSNVTIYVNIDDLTEMFGAGNEPKTVAEFKAKFPNDYYPYSPACFVTSFDERMVCKTKNLFDIDNAVPFKFNTDTPLPKDVSLLNGIYTTHVNNYNYGTGLRIKDGWKLQAGTYVVSAYVVDFSSEGMFTVMGYRYKNADGQWAHANHSKSVPIKGKQFQTSPFTVPDGVQDFRVYLSWQIDDPNAQGFISYKDIQLMKSDITATDYVPYGYV